MNQQPSPVQGVRIQTITDKNPWADGQTVPRLPLPGNLLLCALIIACAAYPLVTTPPMAYTLLLLVALVATLVFVVRSVTVGLLSAALFLGGCLMAGLAGGVYALSLVATIGIGAFLITTCRSYLLAVVPVAAYVITWLICKDASLAVLSLIALPAAGILAYNTMENRSRVSSICLVSIIFGLCVAFAGALLWYQSLGPLSFEAILGAIAQLRTQIINIMLQDAQMMELLQVGLQSTGIDAAALIQSSVELVFNMLPGLCILMLNLFAFTAQLMCIRTYAGTGMKQLMTHTSQLFILSLPSAIIYLICCISSLFSGEMTLVSAVMENLRLVLLPGMCLVGVFKLGADLQRGISKIWVAVIIAAAFFAPTLLILCVSISGAIATLLRPLIARMLLQQQNHHFDHTDHSDHSDDQS